jgi:hypothetical protein
MTIEWTAKMTSECYLISVACICLSVSTVHVTGAAVYVRHSPPHYFAAEQVWYLRVSPYRLFHGFHGYASLSSFSYTAIVITKYNAFI